MNALPPEASYYLDCAMDRAMREAAALDWSEQGKHAFIRNRIETAYDALRAALAVESGEASEQCFAKAAQIKSVKASAKPG